MLTRQQWEDYENYLLDQVELRTKQGGYNTDALTILMLCNICLGLVEHVKPATRRKPAPKKKKRHVKQKNPTYDP